MADQTSPFLLLPIDLISKIISLTSPKDACRAAAVSPAFKSVAESDIVWEQFLPPEHGEITSPVKFSTKKELYFLLCDSNLLLREGKMSIKLHKLSGHRTYMLAARELDIAWIDNPTHWRWTSLPKSRFGEAAELLNVCWLDICATLPLRILTPDTNYAAYLVFKLSQDHYGLQRSAVASVTFRCPTQAEGEITNEIEPLRTRFIPTRHWLPNLVGTRVVQHRFPNLVSTSITPSMRRDGWMEVCLDEFFVQGGNECDVRIRVCETEKLNWKKGLIVEGIEVRPLRTT